MTRPSRTAGRLPNQPTGSTPNLNGIPTRVGVPANSSSRTKTSKMASRSSAAKDAESGSGSGTRWWRTARGRRRWRTMGRGTQREGVDGGQMAREDIFPDWLGDSPGGDPADSREICLRPGDGLAPQDGAIFSSCRRESVPSGMSLLVQQPLPRAGPSSDILQSSPWSDEAPARCAPHMWRPPE